MTATLLVTDTHPLVWYITDQVHKLPKKVARAFDNAVEGRAADINTIGCGMGNFINC